MTIESVTAAVIGAMTNSDIVAIIIILLLFAIFWAALRIIRKERELTRSKNIKSIKKSKKR